MNPLVETPMAKKFQSVEESFHGHYCQYKASRTVEPKVHVSKIIILFRFIKGPIVIWFTSKAFNDFYIYPKTPKSAHSLTHYTPF